MPRESNRLPKLLVTTAIAMKLAVLMADSGFGACAVPPRGWLKRLVTLPSRFPGEGAEPPEALQNFVSLGAWSVPVP